MPGEKSEQTSITGKRLAGFELLDMLGRGAMGVVYKARQVSMNRLVALKILPPRLAKDREFIERFSREAQVVARLNHPNVVQGIDAGEAEGYYYFAMEYVDGETVHSMILREGALDERLALAIVRDMARALGHAQKHGLVHGDIKPGNIMVTKSGAAKLCDLGLARELDPAGGMAARASLNMGTPYYISPEQAQGDGRVDMRSDIYSLGATFFRIVTGEPPFTGKTAADILMKHAREPLPWPSSVNANVSGHASHVIAKMMAKNPDERYQNPEDLEQDLERVLRGDPPIAIDVKFAIPPAKIHEGAAHSNDKVQRRKAALRQFYDICLAAREASREQGIPIGDLPKLLRGNLDDRKPETSLKYAMIVLCDGNYEAALQHARRAKDLGADVAELVEKISALATPHGMVYVPEGEFAPGPGSAGASVKCEAYYIDIWPVTNHEYARFVAATDHPHPTNWTAKPPPEGANEHPVVGVSWDDADCYAKWAGKELPTSAQWERAASGGDGRSWPWGNAFKANFCNTRESANGGVTNVGKYPGGASPFGCMDMAGNVREWLRDAPAAGAADEEQQDARLVAGGSWDDSQDEAKCSHRTRLPRRHRDLKTGFRCVRSL